MSSSLQTLSTALSLSLSLTHTHTHTVSQKQTNVKTGKAFLFFRTPSSYRTPDCRSSNVALKLPKKEKKNKNNDYHRRTFLFFRTPSSYRTPDCRSSNVALKSPKKRKEKQEQRLSPTNLGVWNFQLRNRMHGLKIQH
jgi:hypothetical protein